MESIVLDDWTDLKAKADEVLEKVKAPDYKPELVFVDYRDQLTDEGLAAYLHSLKPDARDVDWDKIMDGEWEADSRWNGVQYELDQFFDAQERSDLEDVFPDLFEEIQDVIRDSDSSNPLKELLSNTHSKLYQIDIKGVDLDGVEVDDDRELLEALQQLGFEADTADLEHNMDQLRDMLSNQGDYMRDMRLVVYLDTDEATGLQEFGGTVKDPYVAAVDALHGACFETRIKGVFTVKPGLVMLDSQLGYGSIDKICGVHGPAFDVEVTINKPKKGN
ncbi:hypothetical protein GS982_01520 [Rhodococcus hoagii]|uniref:Uncharacterized protein n=1 Tax=Rhodococcus hoagii TaxID=43767 RepID=A0A9Q4ZIN3_RHOHA|nr:hypothetical protein [Prescottella equi]NKT77276.1 hypothetical protein [Prescottella equi]NKT78000.1 hypothetical protein [Prescottella equi]NKZ81063.1 hypothetical protein [Prescottella equi]